MQPASKRVPWFLAGLAAVLALAALWPAPGAPGGALAPAVTTRAAVVLIFFLQGLVLPTAEIVRGLREWRRHLVIQIMIFAVPAGLALGLAAIAGDALDPALRVGMIFLGLLPTTVSSATVFTARSGGRTALALCNSTLSNLLGLAIVPAGVALAAGGVAGELDLPSAVRNLGLLIVAPLAAGQALHRAVSGRLIEHRALAGNVCTFLVLFIVYCTFAGAVDARFWEAAGAGALARIGGLTALFGLGAAVAAAGVARAGRWPREDALALFFCATQKTVAAGVPMAQSLFGRSPELLGLVLAPLMFYCLWQFVLAAAVSAWAAPRPA